MTFDANSRDVLTKLWEDRHTHDDEPDVQQQITIIRETVETQGDDLAGAASGAFVHLNATPSQSIAAAGTDIEWAETWKAPFEFEDISAATTLITIPKPGYYDLKVELEWDSFNGGGTVTIHRVRGEVTSLIHPSPEATAWSASAGSLFVDVAKALRFEAGDQVKVTLAHSATSETMASAVLEVELVDRFGQTTIPGAPSLTVSPLSAADDGRVTTNETLFWTDWPAVGNNGWRGWLRFAGVDIPQGATIISAILTGHTTQADTDDTPAGDILAKIRGINEDDHAAPTSLAEWNTDHSNHTTAAVDWDFPVAKVDGIMLDTPNIASIIQEIVNRPGWVSGNAIGIHIDDDGTVDRRQSFEHFESGFNQQFRLSISWEG